MILLFLSIYMTIVSGEQVVHGNNTNLSNGEAIFLYALTAALWTAFYKYTH